MKTLIIALTIALALALPAYAQDGGGGDKTPKPWCEGGYDAQAKGSGTNFGRCPNSAPKTLTGLIPETAGGGAGSGSGAGASSGDAAGGPGTSGTSGPK